MPLCADLTQRAPWTGDVGAHARRHCVTTAQNDVLRLAGSPRAHDV